MQESTKRVIKRQQSGKPLNLTPVERENLRLDAARDPQVKAHLQTLADHLDRKR